MGRSDTADSGLTTAIRRELTLFHGLALAAALLLAAIAPATASAQSAQNVLLVINEQSPDSIRVGDHYVRARSIPASNIVRIKTAAIESIGRNVFEQAIENPIAEWIGARLLHDQILFIVLTKGIPIRIDGSGGETGTMASVDSELTLLYRKMSGRPVLPQGRTANPYFLGERPIAQAPRFTRLDRDIYLVTRLDGFTADDAIGLIDRGIKPVREGRIVLDQKATAVDRGGDMWLEDAGRRISEAGHAGRVLLETTRALAATKDRVFGYFSWGSNDPANQLRDVGFPFAPGAIGGMYVSTDGRTFREPPATWKPAPAGSTTGGQSLAADLIRSGITGVAAHVAEPYLDAIVRPQVLFPAYLSGFTLAESFYLAMPFLSWQNIVIGDPLCAPYLTTPLGQPEIHRGINAEVSLPALFAERRLASLPSFNMKPEAMRQYLRATSLKAQGKPDSEVEAALERATEMEPRLVAAHLMLAQSLESRDEYDAAIVRYRKVIALDANHITALNNLAYALADRKGAAAEALPLAERAYRLSNQAPIIADTLGWVQYKLDKPAAALPLIERAASLLPGEVDVQIHAAAVNVAMNNLARARLYLDVALKADAAVASRADVKALMARILK